MAIPVTLPRYDVNAIDAENSYTNIHTVRMMCITLCFILAMEAGIENAWIERKIKSADNAKVCRASGEVGQSGRIFLAAQQ